MPMFHTVNTLEEFGMQELLDLLTVDKLLILNFF